MSCQVNHTFCLFCFHKSLFSLNWTSTIILPLIQKFFESPYCFYYARHPVGQMPKHCWATVQNLSTHVTIDYYRLLRVTTVYNYLVNMSVFNPLSIGNRMFLFHPKHSITNLSVYLACIKLQFYVFSFLRSRVSISMSYNYCCSISVYLVCIPQQLLSLCLSSRQRLLSDREMVFFPPTRKQCPSFCPGEGVHRFFSGKRCFSVLWKPFIFVWTI